MNTLGLLLAVLSLVTAAGLFFFLWGRGILAAPVTSNPPVEMPVLLVTSNLNKNVTCGDKEFRGTIDIELIYLFPMTNAEVKLAAEIRREDKCDADLSKKNLGIFRNDSVETVNFSVTLDDICEDGFFTVLVTAVNQGPGSTTIAEGTRVDVPALEYSVDMPTQISTTNGRDFTMNIIIGCCGGGLQQTIKFDNINGVRDLSAVPGDFTCAPGALNHTITITGKKTNENQVGVFTVKADSLTGECVLGSVQVE